tara:strand:+ start:547 stop:1017 length:471 start_codon:yes stop_codon:yes gene_type:complete
MNTIGKFKTNFLGKNKSFKIGFNNRSPFSYITGTGVGQPSFSDQGVKSFEPSDWKAAYDTSDAVAAEAKAAQKAGEAGGKAFSAGVDAASGKEKGSFSKALGIEYDEKEEPVSRSEMTLDNADPAMLQMFSDWRKSSSFNSDKSWSDFMETFQEEE